MTSSPSPFGNICNLQTGEVIVDERAGLGLAVLPGVVPVDAVRRADETGAPVFCDGPAEMTAEMARAAFIERFDGILGVTAAEAEETAARWRALGWRVTRDKGLEGLIAPPGLVLLRIDEDPEHPQAPPDPVADTVRICGDALDPRAHHCSHPWCDAARAAAERDTVRLPRELTLAEVNAGAERAEQRVARWPEWKRELGSDPAEDGRTAARLAARGQAEAVRHAAAAGLLQGAPVPRPRAWTDPRLLAADRLGGLDDVVAEARADLDAATRALYRANEAAGRAARAVEAQRIVLARFEVERDRLAELAELPKEPP